MKLRIAGDTNVGKVREQNEDSMIVDIERGLYVVLDGMGGANAGDIASQTARDAILQFVAHRRGQMEPKALLTAAIQSGSAAVFGAAQAVRERHGMGTTCVGMLVDGEKVTVGHVGDSRAYLLREGRLLQLTKDHTIVEELVGRGLLAPEDAERHPYKNVLSRNLGARPETRVDITEVTLEPGDRMMICSDGLYGYAQIDAIQYVLGSGDAPADVARELIELALRGGGGDNVTVIVLETPAQPVSSTVVVRTNGAIAWWQRRARFLQLCKDGGLTRNPIVSGLESSEALELIGLSVCQAIFHDLEKSTGVNVWTFAQNLAAGWFERDGNWEALRSMMDIIANAARTVVDELRVLDSQLGFLLDVAVSRALVVAELALGGLLAERLRAIEADLITLHTANIPKIELSEPRPRLTPMPRLTPSPRATPTADKIAAMPPLTGEVDEETRPGAEPTMVETPNPDQSGFIDRPTIPFLRPEREVSGSHESDEVMLAVDKTITVAIARTAPKAESVRAVLAGLQQLAGDTAGNFAAAVLAARDIYGVRTVDDAGIMPLFDALDHARILVAAAVHQIQVPTPTRARALRALSRAHQRLVSATTGLVLEACLPTADKLRETQLVTSELRDQVALAERRRADLERQIASQTDQSLPWGSRGNTEW